MYVTHLVTVAFLLLFAGCAVPQPQMSPQPTPALAFETGTIMSQVTADAAPLATPVPTQPDPAKATLTGVVLSRKENGSKALAGTAVRLARVYWNADKTDGAFVLEGATSPSTGSKDDGSFMLTDVPPGDYVIVVGDPEARNSIVQEPTGRARIITLQPGQTLDIGNLELRMEP